MKKKSLVFEVIKKELRDIVRDKKTLMMMVIVPMLLYPIMMAGMMVLQDKMINTDEETYSKIGFCFETDEIMNSVIEQLDITKYEGKEEELKEKLKNSEVNAYIIKNDKEFKVYYTEEDKYAQVTLRKCMELIEGYKKIIQSHMLTEEGLVPEEIFDVYTVAVEDISNKDAMTEYLLGMIPTFIIMGATLTAIFAAIDMTAGEKERGTLETLLTFPIKINDIITGKFISTSICTILSSVLGFVTTYITLVGVAKNLESFKDIQLLSVNSFVLIMISLIVFSLLISALAIMVCSKAKSFKEAQNLAEPLSFVSIIPMFFSMAGIKISTLISSIPFVNVALIINDIMSGKIDMINFSIMIISSIIFIVILLKLISKLFKSDKILFS